MLRSTDWTDVKQLANALANGLSGTNRLQVNKRGLHDNTIADMNGGTTLAVGDNSAARPSVSLQPPQLGFTRKQGAVATRRQARAESETRTVPCKVLSIDDPLDPNSAFQVVALGDKPGLSTSGSSGQLIPGAPLGDITQDADTLQSLGYTVFTVYPGTPWAIPGAGTDDHGQPLMPNVGQVINITTNSMHETTTIWAERNRRICPRVSSQVQTTGSITAGGFCCKQSSTDTGPGGT